MMPISSPEALKITPPAELGRGTPTGVFGVGGGRSSLKATKTRFEAALTDGVLSEWQHIVRQGQQAQPFYQPEWFIAFARSFAAGRDVQLLTVTDGEHMVGVLPLMRGSTFFGCVPARSLTSLSGVHSCRFDLITNTVGRMDVAAAAWRALVDDESWDVIEVLDVPERGAFTEIVECARTSGFLVGSWPTRKSPVLRIPGQGRDPFQNCPTHFLRFRKRLRGKLEKLRQRGQVSFKADAPYEEGLAQFLLLESSGWKGTNQSSIASSIQATGFYSSVAESLKGRDQLRLYSLCLDSKPISMHLGVLMDGVYYSPKVAYDEAFSYFAPGHLLVQHIIEDLAARGAHTFEFLGPRAFWKMVWAPECVEHSNWYIFRPNFKGRCLHSLTMRLAPRLRSLHHRVRGDPQQISIGSQQS